MSITGARSLARIHPRGAMTEALLRVGPTSATGCMRGSPQNTGARHQPGGYYLDSSQKIHCPWWMGASNSNNQTHTSVAASSPACGPGVGRCARHRRERMGNARPGRRGAGRRVPGEFSAGVPCHRQQRSHRLRHRDHGGARRARQAAHRLPPGAHLGCCNAYRSRAG